MYGLKNKETGELAFCRIEEDELIGTRYVLDFEWRALWLVTGDWDVDKLRSFEWRTPWLVTRRQLAEATREQRKEDRPGGSYGVPFHKFDMKQLETVAVILTWGHIEQ